LSLSTADEYLFKYSHIYSNIYIYRRPVYTAHLNIEALSSIIATMGGGFFVGALIGFALKKVLKILAIVVGLFFAGLAYLQYQEILNINWNKLQATSQNVATILGNATTQISNHIKNVTDNNDHATLLSNHGIPLTGSMAMGFAVGFMKG